MESLFVIVVMIGCCAYIFAFVATAIGSVKNPFDLAVPTVIMAFLLILSITIIGLVYIDKMTPTSSNFILLLESMSFSKWIGIILTSLVFLAVSILAGSLVRQNYRSYRPRSAGHKSIIVANSIGFLIIGFIFVGTVYAENAIDIIWSYQVTKIGVPVASAVTSWLAWMWAHRSNKRRFYETILLTVIPGLCWFARIVGSPGALWISAAILIASLALFGLRYASEAVAQADDQPAETQQVAET